LFLKITKVTINYKLFTGIRTLNALIAYVKNILIKNNLATQDQFATALEFLEKNPDSNILKVLLKLEILNKDQAIKIKNGFEAHQARKKNHIEGEMGERPFIPQEEQEENAKNIPPSTSELNQAHQDITTCGSGSILEKYLKDARSQGASDFHIVSGASPMIRVDGVLRPISDQVLSHDEAKKIIYSGLMDAQKKYFEANNFLECCLVFSQNERYRTCIVNQHRGIDGSFRIISTTIPTLENLGLPGDLKKLTSFATGIIFLTGPSGTGKSSTLAALAELINQEREDHIITLEDPIEFVYQSKKCHISQRQLIDHTESFSTALRGALREDPDIIILGEMRDYETASLALTAAETGHLVMTTLHTTNAVRTIERVLDMFPPDKVSQIRAMLSKSLRAVICQKLIPKADGKGRVAALEIMYNNNAISNLISTDKMIAVSATIQTSKSDGMVLMDVYIQDLLAKGIIKPEDAHKAVEDKKRITMKKSIRG